MARICLTRKVCPDFDNKCVENLINQQQDVAVDAIEQALAAEVKRMGAAMFMPQPKAENEFLCASRTTVSVEIDCATSPPGHAPWRRP